MKNTHALYSRKKGFSGKIRLLGLLATLILFSSEITLSQNPSRSANGASEVFLKPRPQLASDRILVFGDSFEEYEDFSDSLGEWTLRDLDMTPTYFIEDVVFPGDGEPMAFIVFNPLSADPPLDGPWLAADGDKYAASFSSIPGEGGPNNNWLISPQISLQWQSELSFYARSVTDEWGLELFRIGVSTTGTETESFIIITGDEPEAAPAEWTLYRYDISEFDSDSVYIAIHNISDDAFVFMVDDFQVTGVDSPPTSVDRDAEIPAGITLYQNYPNPFNPLTTIQFHLDEARDIKLSVFTITGRKIAVLAQGRFSRGTHSAVFDGTGLSSGVYLYRLETESFSSSRKFLMLK